MPRTIRKKIYKFEELSDKAKQKVIDDNYSWNVEHNWWESVYDDAEEVGIKITGFDLGRGNDITGELKLHADDVVKEIMKNHGEPCKTYQVAKKFNDAATIMKVTHIMTGADDDDISAEYDWEELVENFTKEILNAYLQNLRDEYEYLTSDEAISESMIANEYEFEADGKRF